MTVTLPQGVPLPTRPSWTFRGTVWTCSPHHRWERSIFPSSPRRPLYCRHMCLVSCYDFLRPQISAILAAHPSIGKCLSLWVRAQSSPLDHKALLTHTLTHHPHQSRLTSFIFTAKPIHHLFPLDPSTLCCSLICESLHPGGLYIQVYICMCVCVCVCVCVYMWYSVCSEYRLAELILSPNIYSFFPMTIVCAKFCWQIRSGVCHKIRSDQIRSVTQSCPTLCDPMNRSTPGLPVHHQLPEFTETHVHRVSDAIQPSHPL